MITAYYRAIDAGLLEHYVPVRKYDYSDYYDNKKYQKEENTNSTILDIVLAAKRKNTTKLLEDLKEEDVY